MSIGHRLAADELQQASLEELYSALGSHDTPKLYERSFTLDTSHDIVLGGGNSVDRRTVYLDRTFYSEIMDNAFKASGLEPQQIVDCLTDHEHTELCILDGDNSIDIYGAAHQRALRKEHQHVLFILGTKDAEKKIAKYERALWPALMRCYQRDPKRAPKDLWCGPLLDDPTERDEEILAIMRKLGVVDAGKRAKYDVHYGFGPQNCNQCSGWNPGLVSQEHGALAACYRINGLVRCDRHCDMWMKKSA